jgi:DNA-directed RNA polymerase subunit F
LRCLKKKAEELKEKIEKLAIPRLKDEHIIKITDLMPANVEVLKVLLQAYTITVTQENLKKIVGVVQEFASEK